MELEEDGTGRGWNWKRMELEKDGTGKGWNWKRMELEEGLEGEDGGNGEGGKRGEEEGRKMVSVFRVRWFCGGGLTSRSSRAFRRDENILRGSRLTDRLFEVRGLLFGD